MPRSSSRTSTPDTSTTICSPIAPLRSGSARRAARPAASCCASAFAVGPRGSVTTTSGSPTTRTRSPERSMPANSPMIRRSTAASRRRPIRHRHPTVTRTGFSSSTRHRGSTSMPSATATSSSNDSRPTACDLRRRMRFCAHMTPNDIEHNYRSPGGAIYGTSSNGKRAAFMRPANRGAKPGLYLVGGSSHPGGGLPLVTTSGRIVADMIADDFA